MYGAKAPWSIIPEFVTKCKHKFEKNEIFFSRYAVPLSIGAKYTIIITETRCADGVLEEIEEVTSMKRDDRDKMTNGVRLPELVEELGLELIHCGADYETALVGIKDVNRPGLQLVGFFDYFDERRLQVIGMAETQMLGGLTSEERKKSFENLFAYRIPALVIARDLDIFPECLEMARKYQRTILHTKETTVDFTTNVIGYLTQALAPSITRHGVLLDIYGEGVLITGESGVGKSETAIELVKRGHRLVADDAVEIRRVSNQLIGKAPELIRHYIELRGIGVIDVQQLFGMSAVKLESQIDFVIYLERWQENKFYDRLGLDEEKVDILGMQLPILTIPVQPGRNLAAIVEVAAMNNRAKKYGYNAAKELVETLERHAMEQTK